MKALITGASSGIGKDMAIYLSSIGYELILVARDKKKLKEVQRLIKTKSKIINIDLSVINNCYKLYKKVKKEDINILINNAGFGLLGEFYNTSLDTELEMIDLNIKATHILTKLFIKYFIEKDNGYILNVSSSAAYLSGPLMSTYYSTKSYIYKLTTAIYKELKEIKSNVGISVLCPGPVKTNFNSVAKCNDNKGSNSDFIAKYAINKMFKRKLIIIPKIHTKIGIIMSKILPIKVVLWIVYRFQNKKR